ncbi:MAG: DUF6591 domain-containing protein [Christensenellales bacterium]|jgi:hypothetical protein
MKRWFAILLTALLLASLAGCGQRTAREAAATTQRRSEAFDPAQDDQKEAPVSRKPAQSPAPAQTQTPAQSPAPAQTQAPEETQASGEQADGMRPAFQEAMDSYEAFMDEYVAIVQQYRENPNDMGLLSDYTAYMSKYADFVEDFEQWDDEEMNEAETAYYIEVQARVSKKLLDAAQEGGG